LERLAPDIVMRQSTDASAPQKVSEAAGVSSDSSLVPLWLGGAKNPLFIIHGVDGRLARFSILTSHLHDMERSIYGIQSQALLHSAPALTRLEDQAAFYLQEMQAIQPRGPYHLLGYSFGAFVALEIAQQIHKQGGEHGLLGVLDNLRMGSSSASTSQPQPRLSRLTIHLNQLRSRGGLKYARGKLAARGLRTAYTLLSAIGQPIPASIRRPYDINWFAAVRYVPRPYPGRIAVFQTTASALDEKATHEYWARLAGGGIETREIPGSHETLFIEPNVDLLAREIAASLANLD
jgi:thioesterase domain-containing protein